MLELEVSPHSSGVLKGSGKELRTLLFPSSLPFFLLYAPFDQESTYGIPSSPYGWSLFINIHMWTNEITDC